jgi:predicted amidohydrolase
MRRITLWLPALLAVSSLAVMAASQPGRNRIVRVVTVSQDQLQGGSNDLFEETLARLNQAASFQPDIACLPELFPRRPPEPVPGPVTERLARWAREHSSYVVFGLKTRMGDRVYNSAVLIDRAGRIAGQFNKIHPTEGELEEGTTPGDVEPPLFQTDFGAIGIQICFDVNWPDAWRRLKQKGAQLVFFPAAYPATRHLSVLARVNEYYIISSTRSRPSYLIDITGEVCAASGMFQPWAEGTVYLSKRLFEIDRHTSRMREVRRKYGRRIDVTWYHDEDQFTLVSLDPELAVEDVIAEFGSLPLSDYIRLSEEAQEAARA